MFLHSNKKYGRETGNDLLVANARVKKCMFPSGEFLVLVLNKKIYSSRRTINGECLYPLSGRVRVRMRLTSERPNQRNRKFLPLVRETRFSSLLINGTVEYCKRSCVRIMSASRREQRPGRDLFFPISFCLSEPPLFYLSAPTSEYISTLTLFWYRDIGNTFSSHTNATTISSEMRRTAERFSLVPPSSFLLLPRRERTIRCPRARNSFLADRGIRGSPFA